MIKLFAGILFFIQFTILFSQDNNDWALFGHAEFEEVFIKEYYSFERILKPDSSILKLEGKEITLVGYYVPIASLDGSVIISKTPYASCFFVVLPDRKRLQKFIQVKS